MSLNFYHKALTAGRRIYTKYWYPKTSLLTFESDPDRAGDRIYELLASGKPCMIARYGANELTTVFNYLGITEHRGDAWVYDAKEWSLVVEQAHIDADEACSRFLPHRQ